MLNLDDQLLELLSETEAQNLIEQGVISGGMLPKVQCALEAVAGGVDGHDQ
ncbi:MAG: hypothetical protein Ct9H300mP14_13910 [Gammaproteobacteria bacterium]|nr:MAG: hypothetical protein Ct9H300mP14_13910 [Gammaproteobacteria bacterium]